MPLVSRPSSPLAIASTVTSVAGSNRCWEMTVTNRPDACCAAMISSVRSTVISAGFSMITSLPAASASMASGTVQSGRRADRDDVDLGAGERLGQRGVRPAAVGIDDLLRPLGVRVDDGDQLQPVGRAG